MTTPTTACANRSCPDCGRRTYGLTPDALFDLLARGLPSAAVAVRATDLRRFARRIGACACGPSVVSVSWRSAATPPPLPADARPRPTAAPAPEPTARAAERRSPPLWHRLGLRQLLHPEGQRPAAADAGFPGLLDWALCLEEG